MALTRDQKTAQLTELKEKLKQAKSVMFAHYIGLTVSDISDLRSKLKNEKAEMKVAKKTLLQIAARELNMPELDEKMLSGPVACIFSMEDPVAGASVAFKYSKAHEQVKLLGGVFENKLLTQKDALTFASLPSRNALLAMFIGVVSSPLRSFASGLNSPLTGFARVLSELAKKEQPFAPLSQSKGAAAASEPTPA